MAYRHLKVPLGQRKTMADNREALAQLRLLTREHADGLPDDAAVAVPADEIRYPHVVYDSATDRLLVRVMAMAPVPPDELALTVWATTDWFDAVWLARELARYLADDTIELAEPEGLGRLRTVKMPHRRVILPDRPEAREAKAAAGVSAGV